jgi:hypothetical protein
MPVNPQKYKQSRMKGSTIMFSPDEYIRLAKGVKYWMGKGLTKFEDVANNMARDFGEDVRPKLPTIWAALNEKKAETATKPTIREQPAVGVQYPDVQGTGEVKQSNWVFGVLVYSFLAMFIPGLIFVFGDFLSFVLERLGEGAVWFMKLSWFIKIPVFIVLGICFQSLRPLYNSKKLNPPES